MKTLVIMLTSLLIAICVLFGSACAPANEVVLASTPEPTPAAIATPIPMPTPSPVPPESLSRAQKADMIWTRGTYDYYSKPATIYIFYLHYNGQYRLVWVKKESNPPGNGFDLLDVFNEEIMFHVSIQPEDQASVTPSEFPKYVDRMNESLSQYSIVAAGKLLDINDLYANNNIDRVGTDTPYDVLLAYFAEAPDGFGDWSKERMIDAFIDVTPAQYILPFWEYIPNSVTPDSYFNPPSPTPAPIPMLELTLEQKELLLGIGKNSKASKIGTIQVYHFDLKGKKYRCWVVSILNEEKTEKSNGYKVVDLFEVFNRQYLFSLSFPNNGCDTDGQGYAISQGCDFLSETNPALKGMKLEHAFSLSQVAFYYQILEIDYNNDEFLNGFCEYFQGDYTPEKAMELEQTRQTVLSVDEMKEHFLNSTPQEEILPFWVFTPGARIPEELKGIYSETDYPPAPAE